MATSPTCPNNCVCCESHGWPSTLYLDLTSADCPALNGQQIQLQAPAGNDGCIHVQIDNAWVGQLNVSGCVFEVGAWFHTNTCTWLVGVNGCVDGPIAISESQVDCNWTTGSNTQKWDCGCCGNHNVTATLSL